MDEANRSESDRRWPGRLLSGCRYLIHDRASVFSEDFRMILEAAGVESVRLPARSPNWNAFAERFVRSSKDSCLDRMVLIGESSLHRAISEFVLYYHAERNHEGLANRIIRPEFAEFPNEGAINCRKRLGGLLRYYYREAARECTRISGQYGVGCQPRQSTSDMAQGYVK
jgi:hypothetical protein